MGKKFRLINMGKNSKGLSAVVATVLIIFLTIVAVGIISSYLVPFVKNQLAGTECVKYREYYTFDDTFDLLCTNGTLHGVSLASKSDEEISQKISGFNLQFVKQGGSKLIEVREGRLRDGEFRMLNSSINEIEIAMNGDILTYVFTGDNYTGVNVFPVIKNEGKENVCSISDYVKLERCSGVKLTI